jgi:hypothetical protein
VLIQPWLIRYSWLRFTRGVAAVALCDLLLRDVDDAVDADPRQLRKLAMDRGADIGPTGADQLNATLDCTGSECVSCHFRASLRSRYAASVFSPLPKQPLAAGAPSHAEHLRE